MNLGRSSLKIFFSNIVNSIILFIGLFVFARRLAPAALGGYFLYEASMRMISVVTDLGLGDALEKRISEGGDQDKIYAATAGVVCIVALVVIILLLTLSEKVNSYLGFHGVIYLIIGAVLFEATHLQLKLLGGALRAGERAEVNISRQAVWLITGYYFVSSGYGTLGLVWALIYGTLVSFLFSLYKIPPEFSRPSFDTINSLIEFAKYNMVNVLGRYLFNWTDILIIGFYLGNSAVGSYETAWRVAGLTILLSRAVGTVSFPQISAWHSEGDFRRINEYLPAGVFASIFVVIPAFFGTLILSSELLHFLFGRQYASAAPVLVLIVFGKIFQALNIFFEKLLQGLNQAHKSSFATAISSLVNILLNAILIFYMDLIGAAIATSVSYLISMFIHMFYIGDNVNIEINFPYKPTIYAIIFSGISLAPLVTLSVNSLRGLLIAVAACAFVYILLIVLSSETRQKAISIFSVS